MSIENCKTKSIFPLLETIRLEEGRLFLLPYHQERLTASMANCWPQAKPHLLASILSSHPLPSKGEYKLRFLYAEKDYCLELQKAPNREIRHLTLVNLPESVHYHMKFTDRNALDEAKQKTQTDEVLFFQKGLLTDAYYYNVVVKKDGQLWTPSSPLLRGVQRQFLLDQNLLKQADITPSFLAESEGVFLINALHPLGRQALIPHSRILGWNNLSI